MRKLIRYSMYAGFVMLLCNSSGCKKESTETFCSVNRQLEITLADRTGSVIYYQKYNRYAVQVDTLIVGNIDTQITGLTCGLPKEFQVVGTKVTINGQLKKFNSDENIRPQLGGEELYYLQIDKISKL